MKLYLVFVFLFIFPYIDLIKLILVFLMLLRKSININYIVILMDNFISHSLNYVFFIFLSILVSNNYQTDTEKIKGKLLTIPHLKSNIIQINNYYFYEVNIYYLTYFTSLYIIKFLYISITHLLVVSNLYLITEQDCLLSNIIIRINFYLFNKKYHSGICNLCIMKSISILEISIENLKNLYFGVKCKSYRLNNTYIICIKYCLVNFLDETIQKKIKFTTTIWHKLSKNKV
uniref:Uncharacterized protein n=1 Tax=Polysiphonia sertularioides TaxID=945028 RepID=A0A1Z1MGI0_9FLOR|nr:hypothetical protein [Polysiphonia sertularioides]